MKRIRVWLRSSSVWVSEAGFGINFDGNEGFRFIVARKSIARGDSAMFHFFITGSLRLAVFVLMGLAMLPYPAGAVGEIGSTVEGRALIADNPLDPASYINFSRFLVDIGELEDAEEVLKVGRNKANPSSNLLVELALVYETRNRMSKAEAAARDAVTMDPDNPAAQLRLGEIHYRMGSKKAAVVCYRLAQKLSPLDSLPRVRLVNGLMDIGETAEAEDLCLQYISTDPDNPDLWLALGRSFEKQGKNREAFTTYGQVLSIDPMEAEAYARQGRLYCRFGQFESAEHACRKALTLDQDNLVAHAYLGIACSYLDNGKDARKHARIAEAGGMNMSAVWDKLGK